MERRTGLAVGKKLDRTQMFRNKPTMRPMASCGLPCTVQPTFLEYSLTSSSFQSETGWPGRSFGRKSRVEKSFRLQLYCYLLARRSRIISGFAIYMIVQDHSGAVSVPSFIPGYSFHLVYGIIPFPRRYLHSPGFSGDMEMTWYAYCITEQSSVQQGRVRRPFQFEQLRGINSSPVMGFPTGEFVVLVSAYDRNLP